MQYETYLAAAQAMTAHHDEHEQGQQHFYGFTFPTIEAAQAADLLLKQKHRELVVATLQQTTVQDVETIFHLSDLAASHPFASQCVVIKGTPALMIRARGNEIARFVVQTMNDSEQRRPCFAGSLPMRSPAP